MTPGLGRGVAQTAHRRRAPQGPRAGLTSPGRWDGPGKREEACVLVEVGVGEGEAAE